MNAQRLARTNCTLYLAIIFLMSFFLSSIKNHFFVLGLNYIASESAKISEFLNVYIFEFWREYRCAFFLALLPVLFINYLFIYTIVHLSGKKVFNFISAAVIITCVVECISQTVNHGNNMFQMCFLPVFMILVVVLEFILNISINVETGIMFPFAVAVSINMYYGICILSTPYAASNFIPFAVSVVVLYCIRYVAALFNKQKQNSKILLPVLISLILILSFLILFLSWRDYSTNDAYTRDWRQLYYVAVYSAFFFVFIAQYLIHLNCIHTNQNSKNDAYKRKILIVHAVLLIIIPLLCMFAVHGILLIILNGVVLLLSFFIALRGPTCSGDSDNIRYFVTSILLMTFTYAYMGIDPIVYLNASTHISMIWPMIIFLGAIYGVVTVVLQFVIRSPKESIADLFRKVIGAIKKSSFEAGLQGILFCISVGMLFVFALCYLVKVYAIESSKGLDLDVGFINQDLEGFGGIYILSWCMIPFFLNAVVFFTSLLISPIRSLSKKGEKHAG